MIRRSPLAQPRSAIATSPGRTPPRPWLVWPEDDSGRCWTVDAVTAIDAIVATIPRLTSYPVTVYDVEPSALSIRAHDYSARLCAEAV